MRRNEEISLKSVNGYLQRYVLMRRTDVDLSKPDVAVEALSTTGIAAMPHCQAFAAFAKKTVDPVVDLLLTPVDSEEGRRHLAKHLPRSVLNAATGNSTVTVSRHGSVDGRACLHCLYLPEPGEMTTERRLARDWGMSEGEVASLLAANHGVGDALLRRIEVHRGVPRGSFQPWIGQHIQSFYQRAVCGTAPVTAGTASVSAPLSFISATAGVLLAAELIKLRNPGLTRYALNNCFRLDTLCSPNPAFRLVRMADKTGRCICADQDYVQMYRRRY